ncbi:MAG: hypothetical protein J7K46_00725 [Bacteroidales bacterium]|nr:hypothetical protein [Bacteroidales bacterium]
MKPLPLLILVLFITGLFSCAHQEQEELSACSGIPDTLFLQEYHEPHPLGSPAANDVRSVVVDKNNTVWAGTQAGLFLLSPGLQTWQPALNIKEQGPVFDLFLDKSNSLWIAAWNGLYKISAGKTEKIPGIRGPVAVTGTDGTHILAIGPSGFWRQQGTRWVKEKMLFSREDRCLQYDDKQGFYLGTGRGVWHSQPGDTIHLWTPAQLISDNIFGMDFHNPEELWIGGLGGITVYNSGKDTKSFVLTPNEGLSNIWVRCIKRSPSGTMWVGTDLGVVRFRENKHSLRHSRRWLLNDQVRDIAFDKEGNAWIATAGGVSAIKRKSLTLAQKADYYERLLLRRHVRAPWIVEKCRLTTPGDTAAWEPMDDDNDGQYTGMYLAMESYRYAVTHDPAARENAVKTFHALKFLQTVTGTDGFVARTVIPVNWKTMADPNKIIDKKRYADKTVRNPREKKVEKHWRLSKDGQWLWKGDTSSDEITGHMYGYTIFWEIIAQDDPVLKKEVKDHVTRIVDYIVNNEYLLKDIDGKHTTWGVWAPEYLNDNPDWAPERGINSLEILSYLKLAWQVSKKKKYRKEYDKLLNKYHYRTNILHAKSIMPAWRTFIDDELVALAYPALMMYEKDPVLLELYKKSMNNWYEACKNDGSPFYYYTIDAFLQKNYKLIPSVCFLRDNPLDLIRWTVDNRTREDLTLTHSPILEDTETSRLVPASERGIMRWDKNPWAAVQGDNGHTEASPTFWLLPYWMGRYYHFITEPTQ